ncbi:MAG TPA: helix-turn-helix transcriptional regulator [Allosphingosinicella sp.]
MTTTIGDNIRKARLAKSMTQEQLGVAAGNRSVNQINGYERGRSRPSPRVLGAIAGALGVTPESLLASHTPTAGPDVGEDFVRDFKNRCARALNIPVSAIKVTIEVVQ